MKTSLHKLICFTFILFSGHLRAQLFETYGSAYPIPTISSATCSSADTCFTLTDNFSTQQGAVWDLELIDLSVGFDATFCMFLGDNDGGADGFAFVMRSPTSNTFGAEGGGLGYGTLNGDDGIYPSVAIEFDTYENSDLFDIFEDHTQLVLNGNVSGFPAVAPISLLPGNPNVEDNNFHNARIVWDPVSHNFSMYFDGNLRFTYTDDLVNNVFGGDPQILWGFTASTGALFNLQQICFPKINLNLPDMSICASDSAYVSYFHDNLTEYLWLDPQLDTLVYWNSGLGTQLTDTGIYVSQEGSYTLSVEFNNHTYTENIQVDLLDPPFDTNIVLCRFADPADLIDLLGNPPLDGTWSGPSALLNGVSGTLDPELHEAGTYTYTSNTLSVCPQNTYNVDVEIIDVVFHGTVDLIPCSETAYEVEVNPVMSNGNTSFTYSWISPGASLDPNANSCEITLNSDAVLTLEIVSTDLAACSYDTTFNLEFIAAPELSLGENVFVCVGETVTLTAAGSWESFLWNNGNTSQSIQPVTSGDYWCEVSTADGCTYRDTVNVTFNPLPVIILQDFDPESCSPYTEEFSINVSPAGSSFTWLFDFGPSFVSENPVSVTYNTVGDYGFKVIAVSPELCVDSLERPNSIHVHPNPIPAFDFELLSASGGNNVVEFQNQSLLYEDLLWIFNAEDSTTEENPEMTFSGMSKQIVVELIASNAYCSDSITQLITIPEQLIFYVPNSFTPDGNQFNNVFQPVMTEGYVVESYRLAVYDRWGELLFESFDPHTGWDGSYGGQLVMDDTYAWKIELIEMETRTPRIFTGHVSLMK
ncbi:MAG: hypothetical protein K0R65_1301 [Crocinitomicaceae bacterium]|jgi:gliding motility-associated-like protein|nr:hypothetical protein [Crocinitomicaceae bacterium]